MLEIEQDGAIVFLKKELGSFPEKIKIKALISYLAFVLPALANACRNRP